jgi:hypothetical protein
MMGDSYLQSSAFSASSRVMMNDDVDPPKLNSVL